jgi:putative restriction endonuclease
MNTQIDFEHEIENLRVNKVGAIVSLHKPLLLLLAISEILRGHENQFIYNEIEITLTQLLSKYGLKNSSKTNPHYPFVYLAGSKNLWECSIKKTQLLHPDAASRNELLGSVGKFPNEFFIFLKNKQNAFTVLFKILNQYWPEAYHQEILNDLGIFETISDLNVIQKKSERSRKFVEEVLDAYERKCAICSQSIRIGETLIGIDACHIKPIQHFGLDSIRNGIALCKIHHWGLDRGAISISKEMNLKVSKKLNGNKLDDFFTNFEEKQIFIPRYSEFQLDVNNVLYHEKYIFVK